MQVPNVQEASNVLFLFNDMLDNTSLPCLVFALTVKLFHPSSPASPETAMDVSIVASKYDIFMISPETRGGRCLLFLNDAMF